MLGYLRLIKERVHDAGILPEEWERYVGATGEISRIGYREEIEAAIWVYPLVRPQCPETVYETGHFDDRAKSVLDEEGIVYLTPPSTKDALPSSIQAQFTTDFWSVGTFAAQQGGMGLQNLQQYPEARALLASIYRYLSSEQFAPEQIIEKQVIASLVQK